jgi:hypothetical protein
MGGHAAFPLAIPGKTMTKVAYLIQQSTTWHCLDKLYFLGGGDVSRGLANPNFRYFIHGLVKVIDTRVAD